MGENDRESLQEEFVAAMQGDCKFLWAALGCYRGYQKVVKEKYEAALLYAAMDSEESDGIRSIDAELCEEFFRSNAEVFGREEPFCGDTAGKIYAEVLVRIVIESISPRIAKRIAFWGEECEYPEWLVLQGWSEVRACRAVLKGSQEEAERVYESVMRECALAKKEEREWESRRDME